MCFVADQCVYVRKRIDECVMVFFVCVCVCVFCSESCVIEKVVTSKIVMYIIRRCPIYVQVIYLINLKLKIYYTYKVVFLKATAKTQKQCTG